MTESFEITIVLPVSPQRLYAAWLDSDEHTAMTGGVAEIDPRVGGRHIAWDGYITGVNLELEPDRRIVQTWRAADFPADAPPSRLEVVLDRVEQGTRLTLRHSGLPDGYGDRYRDGWTDNYFEPMKEYFAT
jgi:uncharacterized protein YndB with AHSA1/START domain